MLTGQMPVYDSFFVWKRTKNQVALSLRLGVPLAETLVLGVVACCEGNDHKTCLDCSSQLQLKGQSTPPVAPSFLILLSPSSLCPSPIPQTRNSCSVTAARPPRQDLGVDYRAWPGVKESVLSGYAAPPPPRPPLPPQVTAHKTNREM